MGLKSTFSIAEAHNRPRLMSWARHSVELEISFSYNCSEQARGTAMYHKEFMVESCPWKCYVSSEEAAVRVVLVAAVRG